ncbi:integral membrane sensor signal transduction histidine kinase [Desulfofundulus kuznetsovii DSM 6115]|uniref:histidine kinase n=1 Tax=Desulfofundulus kuznetsovii (strain DSM 6115 / VKM B-1805 / 17) TaxID=760568 RepID=A0AAU8PFD8_DESK7|nr:integral membrane sensor signal transduction histidine kinase [Desulfofundulus kuznetsovii DSM 6115]
MRGSLSRKFMIRITAILLLITGINLGLDYYEQKNQILQELKEKSRVITGQLLATREFIARNQDRINYDSRGHFEFKGLNPAAVGRGVGEIFNQSTGYHIKQTRLNPRNPGNAPDAFEIKGLQALAQNPSMTEFYGFDEQNGEKVFRYMVPLRVEEYCLQCHGEPAGRPDISGYPREGYRVGDLGGAISLIVPVNNLLAALRHNLLRHLGFFFILLLVILGVVYFLIQRLVTGPLNQLRLAAVRLGEGELDLSFPRLDSSAEIGQLAAQFRRMARQLHDLYTGLEQKVQERTAQLQEANELLERQRQELENANRELTRASEMKSRFLAGMSHEMRTPLTSIIAFSELLLQEVKEENIRQRQNLQEIKASARRLLALIEDLLDLARIEAGRFQLHRELVDLADIFESIDKTLSPLIEANGLGWYWEVEPDVPLMEVDGEKIRRAILNLAHNAVKFTPPGGEVEMRAGFDPGRKEVFIRVADNGMGIEPEELDRVFERFYQAGNSRAHKYGGSGLGLSLARELVELHGGYISVTSKPGEGSTFVIHLPVA